MKKFKITFVAGLLAISNWAFADVSYTNFGVGYVNGDFGNADADGFQLRGNFAINSSVYLLADYTALDIDGPGTDDDLDILNFGAGWHTGLNEVVDFVATASILDVDRSSSNADGLRLTGGVRGLAGNEFEFGAHLVFEDIDDAENDTGFEFEGRYFFSGDASVGFTLRDVSDLEVFRIDVRFDF